MSVRAGDSVQAWRYDNGFPGEYTLTDPEGVSSTRIHRDNDGRITSIDDPSGFTEYAHDAAGQLVSAATPKDVREWSYDTAGRLTTETCNGETTEYTYDVAGELTEQHGPTGTTRYDYDGAGRRIRETGPDRHREYDWDPRGFLHRIIDDDAEQQLWVDALGELANANGTRISWDTAAHTPTLNGFGDHPVFTSPGIAATTGGTMRPQGWRTARNTATGDPWTLALSPTDPHAPATGLTPQGLPRIAGLEWMGARSYDPTARGFLSVDPLEPITGTSWAANPYAYAGNDPLHQLDPHGLSPVTDKDQEKEGSAFDPTNLLTFLMVAGLPNTYFDKSVVTARHVPNWVKFLIRSSQVAPFISLPITAVLTYDAWFVHPSTTGRIQHTVSLILTIGGFAYRPLAIAALLWDLGWLVGPSVVDWWVTDVPDWAKQPVYYPR